MLIHRVHHEGRASLLWGLTAQCTSDLAHLAWYQCMLQEAPSSGPGVKSWWLSLRCACIPLAAPEPVNASALQSMQSISQSNTPCQHCAGYVQLQP